MNFVVTEEDKTKIAAWQATIQEALVHDVKSLYTGAIGGALAYEFTPTSLGVVFKVHDALSGETLDLSDYENW